MCAIFGSSSFKTYKKLYEMCKRRGEYAYGSLYIKENVEGKYFLTVKAENTVHLKKSDAFYHGGNKLQLDKLDFYLGHTQAPTSSIRHFNIKTSHPFRCNDWIVAHNGVLTNFNELKQQVKNTSHYNAVDSSVIPALLNENPEDKLLETEIICSVLKKLKGTFGVWIYNIQTGNKYVARSGSTIYGNFLTNDFSSLRSKGFVPYEEGVLYLLTPEGTTGVDTFKSNSPFFIL